MMADGIEKKRDLTTDEILTTASITMLVFTILLIGVIIVLLFKLKTELSGLLLQTKDQISYSQQGFWEKTFQLHPLKTEGKLLMDHAYDGIQELDNPTPPWFMFLFYSTIVFAIGYGILYHWIGDGNIMKNEYAAELKEAEINKEAYLKKAGNLVNESNVTLISAKDKIAEGKTIYEDNCLACHGKFGEGLVGPNLTDEFWIHGGGIKNIFHVVTEGVPEKGMISWKKQLNPLQIQLVSSYIIGLKGTNPPNQKAPQGEKYGDLQANVN